MIPSTAAATNRISHDTNHAHGLAISSRESSELPSELPTEAPLTIGEVLPTGCIIELGGQAASTVIAQLLAEVAFKVGQVCAVSATYIFKKSTNV